MTVKHTQQFTFDPPRPGSPYASQPQLYQYTPHRVATKEYLKHLEEIDMVIETMESLPNLARMFIRRSVVFFSTTSG